MEEDSYLYSINDDGSDRLTSKNEYVQSRDDDEHGRESPHRVHVDGITRECGDEHDLQIDVHD